MNKTIRTVLIIEDNEDIRESTAEILEFADYKVYTAENGKKGVELAQSHQPDIILCDIMMPELDGYGVLYMLNKNEQTASIPFIFITAKTERVDMRKGMEMGADDYLTKPFGDMELLNAIETRLQKREVAKKIPEAQPLLKDFWMRRDQQNCLLNFRRAAVSADTRKSKPSIQKATICRMSS